MTARPNLRPVPTQQGEPPAPDLSYEWQERQRVARKDWAAIHVRGDRNPPLAWWPHTRRPWR